MATPLPNMATPSLIWQARRIWESIVNRCRDLARFAHAYKEEIGAIRVTRLANLLCAYP